MSAGCAHAVHESGIAGDPSSALHRLDPRAKVGGLVGVTLVAVSTPLAAWPAWLACVAVLAAVATAARVPARVVWRRSRAVLPAVLLAAAFLPFLHRGGNRVDAGIVTLDADGLGTFAAVAAKASIGTVCAVLLAATTRFADVLSALETARVPRSLLLVAAMTERYLHVLVDEVRRMRCALAARGHRPRHALRAAPAGRVAGALFLRAHARGERVHRAMLARGHRGMPPAATPLGLGRADVGFLMAVAGVLLATRVLAEVLA
jgi:cobalt/nickel transport system permease protein